VIANLEVNVDDSPILICYDDSDGAKRAIEVAAALLVDRKAVVLAVGPPLTVGGATPRSG